MNSTALLMICKNCSSTYEGKYCHECGQRTPLRLETRDVIARAIDGLFNLDKGFLFTMKELTLRPSMVIAGYIEGQRQKFYPPVKYIIVSIAVYSATMLFDDPVMRIENITGQPELSAKQSPQETFTFFEEYLNFILFSLTPIFALLSKWLFRKRNYSYAEHFVVNGYAFSQMNYFYVINTILILFMPDFISKYADLLVYFISMVYMIWLYITTYNEKLFAGILKSLTIIVLSWVVILLLGLVIIIINNTSIRLN